MKEPIKFSDHLSLARAELAEQEEQLIQALVANGAVPPAVSASHVASASHSLLLKRARGIARAHPEVLAHCAESFMELMSEYAVLHPGSHPGGICADAAGFKRFVRTHQECADHKRRGLRQSLATLFQTASFWMRRSISSRNPSTYSQ